jgi:hypothetical protein
MEKCIDIKPDIHMTEELTLTTSTLELHGNTPIVNVSISFDSGFVYSSDKDGGFFMSRYVGADVQISGKFSKAI